MSGKIRGVNGGLWGPMGTMRNFAKFRIKIHIEIYIRKGRQ